jgi:ribosomal protein S18 acetylase RimI-like enzyme
MNFYSDEIINKIIDSSEIENMLENLETFKKNVRYLLHRFTGNDIQSNYIDSLLSDERNKVVFYCMDFEFCVFNCPVIMIYRKYVSRETPNIITYYILMLCTKPKFRNLGYASKLLNDFIATLRKKHASQTQEKNIRMVLSSVENAVLFYEAYGFRWTRDTLLDHKVLMQTEKYETDKEYFIMEYSL